MNPLWRWPWHNQIALALLVICGAATLYAVAAPDEQGELPAPRSVMRPPFPPHKAGGSDAHLDSLVAHVAARDPFRTDRTRPAKRYRTVADRAADAAPAPTAPPGAAPVTPAPAPQQAIVVRGIATASDGTTLVAVEIGGEQRLVRVGEAFNGYRLVSARGGEVRLQGPDGVRIVRIGS